MAERVSLAGLQFDKITEAELIGRVGAEIAAGRGGTIVTPNVDICRRTRREPASRALVLDASLVVPDGVPLLWAARLAGDPLTQRIAGADLIFSLSRAADAGSWPVFVLGGMPGADGQPGAAELAASNLAGRFADLKIVGAYSPPERFDAAAGDIGELLGLLAASQPRLVFVGLGFPKQELLISRLRAVLPQAWFVACGAAIPFAAGQVTRAPLWLQRIGMEWTYRLLHEPRRLFRRYLAEDLPFALMLLAGSGWHRLRAHRGQDAWPTSASSGSGPATSSAARRKARNAR
jgi:exopolysaccharide biosynthesis WecB/TagA/CpsF family protein